ncbi:MAG: CDP-glucose 4,6-dehydratase [Alphaproteobacteria bacterium]|nr:CDP-glucose 4,6-dehydratase [Alphaproteobacteria bacterium]
MADRNNFWRGRRVLVTGHTGFKGAWLALWLEHLGAEVCGYALAPEASPNLFDLLSDWHGLSSIIGDIRDRDALAIGCVFADPDVVFHLAAQSLVRRGHSDPQTTFSTNVQGTANLLGALDGCPGLRAIVVATSDKCYRNDGSGRPFVETDPLGGDDPYSASKAAQEMICHGWSRGLYQSRERAPRLATARAGNVIGGGDWAEDRVLPDLFRALARDEPVLLRNPQATRPWQHVLEPLHGYLAYAEQLVRDTERTLPTALNFGPDAGQSRTVAWLVDQAIGHLRAANEPVADWQNDAGASRPEASSLALDPSLANQVLGWRPVLSQEEGVAWSVEWYKRIGDGEPARDVSLEQIARYESLLTTP